MADGASTINFVALSFDPEYDKRFNNVIIPVIEGVKIGDVGLKAYRVNLSKTGNSILTDIAGGIAHSQMVLADVSSFGRDATTGEAYRNGNVMYEVGLALACRQTSEVLLVRDDHDKFLFDVSTIPHMTIDFTDTMLAVATLQGALASRLRERNTINDARVKLAVAKLSNNELQVIKNFGGLSEGSMFGFSTSNLTIMEAIPRLLDKQILQTSAEFEAGHSAYEFTSLGFAVAALVKAGLRKVKADTSQENVDKLEQPNK